MADVETKETKVVSTPEKKAVAEEAPVCEKPKPAEKKVVEAENDDSNSKTSENGSATNKEATSNGSSEEKEVDEKEAESEKSTNGSATESTDACSLKRKSVGGDASEVDAVAKDVTSPKKAKLAAANEKSANDTPAAKDKPAEAPVAQTNGIEPPTI